MRVRKCHRVCRYLIWVRSVIGSGVHFLLPFITQRLHIHKPISRLLPQTTTLPVLSILSEYILLLLFISTSGYHPVFVSLQLHKVIKIISFLKKTCNFIWFKALLPFFSSYEALFFFILLCLSTFFCFFFVLFSLSFTLFLTFNLERKEDN